MSESEHGWARKIIQLQTTDPETGSSPYTNSRYRSSTTLVIPRVVAVLKTRGDIEVIQALKAAQRSGQPIDPALLRAISPEAAIERTIEAARSLNNTQITELQVILATHGQLGDVHAAGPGTATFLQGLTTAEINSALSPLNVTPTPSIWSRVVRGAANTIAGVGSRGASFLRSGKATAVSTARAAAGAAARTFIPEEISEFFRTGAYRAVLGYGATGLGGIRAVIASISLSGVSLYAGIAALSGLNIAAGIEGQRQNIAVAAKMREEGHEGAAALLLDLTVLRHDM